MNVENMCAQRRVCIGTDKKGAHILNRRYANKSLLLSDWYHDNPIIPIVLATLDILIECANPGANKTGGIPFYWREDYLLFSLLHNVWCTT